MGPGAQGLGPGARARGSLEWALSPTASPKIDFTQLGYILRGDRDKDLEQAKDHLQSILAQRRDAIVEATPEEASLTSCRLLIAPKTQERVYLLLPTMPWA